MNPIGVVECPEVLQFLFNFGGRRLLVRRLFSGDARRIVNSSGFSYTGIDEIVFFVNCVKM